METEDNDVLIDRIERGEHEQVAAQEDGAMVVTLLRPIVIGKSGSITELVLRRPKVKHMRAMDAASGDVAKGVALLAAVAGRAPRELDELDIEDFKVCSAVLGFFSRRRPATGVAS